MITLGFVLLALSATLAAAGARWGRLRIRARPPRQSDAGLRRLAAELTRLERELLVAGERQRAALDDLIRAGDRDILRLRQTLHEGSFAHSTRRGAPLNRADLLTLPAPPVRSAA